MYYSYSSSMLNEINMKNINRKTPLANQLNQLVN